MNWYCGTQNCKISWIDIVTITLYNNWIPLIDELYVLVAEQCNSDAAMQITSFSVQYIR